MRWSTNRLASDKACRGAKPYSSPISLTISTVAIRRRFVQSPAEAERQPAAAGQALAGQRQAQLVAVAGITGSDLSRLEIPAPPLPEQRAIAHILGTLDDKIELNRRMSKTREEMARPLFKSWFVDFDPVRAKVDGRDPDISKPLADLGSDVALRRIRITRSYR